MVRCSNNLVGILNFVTFLLSVPILGGGIWLTTRASSDCLKYLEKPIIVLGVFLMLVSLAGLIGACCRVSWLLWVYLLVMFLLIVIVFCFTIFTFVVTNPGTGKVLSNRGYKEYKLGDYSNWLQKQVNSTTNWNKFKSCLIDGKVCKSMNETGITSVAEFYKENLSAIQSGCCKPEDECNYEYVSPTEWMTTVNSTLSANSDCSLWENDANTLCFNCQSCKAGFIDNLKSDWKKEAIVNIVFLIFLIIVYSVGCCAFRNNRRDNSYHPSYKGYP